MPQCNRRGRTIHYKFSLVPNLLEPSLRQCRNKIREMNCALFFGLLCLVFAQATERSLNRTDLKCSGRPHHNVSLTAYYPDFESDNESDYLDARGKKLRTLQDYIDGRGEYVTVGMDLIPEIPYGTRLCSPELNKHFGMQIPLQVRDHGSDLSGKGFTTLEICVRSEGDSYDIAVNRPITIYV